MPFAPEPFRAADRSHRVMIRNFLYELVWKMHAISMRRRRRLTQCRGRNPIRQSRNRTDATSTQLAGKAARACWSTNPFALNRRSDCLPTVAAQDKRSHCSVRTAPSVSPRDGGLRARFAVQLQFLHQRVEMRERLGVGAGIGTLDHLVADETHIGLPFGQAVETEHEQVA